MPRIGLLSDTHGYLDERIFHHFEDCDEIWHAGDFGTLEVSEKLSTFRPLMGVYGNIDGQEIRIIHPKEKKFTMEGLKIWMTHIGGSPEHYNTEIKQELKINPPDIFICGHSHILRIISDKKLKRPGASMPMLYINPGAAGKYGFHKIRTIVKFDLREGRIENMKVIELGKRSDREK